MSISNVKKKKPPPPPTHPHTHAHTYAKSISLSVQLLTHSFIHLSSISLSICMWNLRVDQAYPSSISTICIRQDSDAFPQTNQSLCLTFVGRWPASLLVWFSAVLNLHRGASGACFNFELLWDHGRVRVRSTLDFRFGVLFERVNVQPFHCLYRGISIHSFIWTDAFSE